MNRVCWVCGGDGEVVVVIDRTRWWRCRVCRWNWLEHLEDSPEQGVAWLGSEYHPQQVVQAGGEHRN